MALFRFWQNREGWTHDFLASIVVFLVALPLCMGIAIASGVPVSAGLITGIVGGLVVGCISGAPLQVSGPAAGLTVVVYEAVQKFGLEMLGLVVLIAGILQLVAGWLRLGQWFRAVSPAVISGMLAGIGVLIFSSQFHVMLDDVPQGSGIQNLVTIPRAISKALNRPEFPQRDLRHDQRTILQRLGELHRQQMLLNEQVAEHVPGHLEVSETPPDLSPFVSGQQAVIDQLEELLSHSLSVFAAQPERQEKVRESGRQTLTALTRSRDGLKAENLGRIPANLDAAATALARLEGAYKNHEFAAAIGVLTILVLVLWKALAPGRLSFVPAPLVAVIVATTVAAVAQLPVLYVEVPASLAEEIHFPTTVLLKEAAWPGLLGAGLLMAVIASAETLLSATAVDQLHHGPRARYDRELSAQGVGNIICGLLGALPMTGVIVRSSANVNSGARSRLSAILHGLWLLLFVAAFGTVLRIIPTAALAAVLVYTGYKLVDVKSVRNLLQYGWGEVLIFLATVTVIVLDDLLTGVLTGLALAVLKLVYRFTRLKVRVEQSSGAKRVVLKLEGMATFIRLPKLARALEKIPEGTQVTFDMDRLSYLDHACLELLMSWAEQHRVQGGEVEVDWDELRRFVREGRRLEVAAADATRVA